MKGKNQTTHRIQESHINKLKQNIVHILEKGELHKENINQRKQSTKGKKQANVIDCFHH